MYRRHLMAALGHIRRKKSVIFDESLRSILVVANASGTLLRPRHQLIARWVGKELSSQDLREEAIVSLLTELSADVTPSEIKRRSPAYIAYRGLISSEGLFELFGGQGDVVLRIYEALRTAYDGDFLFWLQYGMAHAKIGNLDVAENFVRQSLEIRSTNNFQAMHQLGILHLMQAARSQNPGAMKEQAEEGRKILRVQIMERGDEESYPYGGYMTYVSRWYISAKALITAKEWEDLRAIAREGVAKYPLDDVIREALREVERSYLMRLVKE